MVPGANRSLRQRREWGAAIRSRAGAGSDAGDRPPRNTTLDPR